MHGLARRIGVTGDGWARGVVADALVGAGCHVVTLEPDASRHAGPMLIDAVVVVADDTERLRAAARYGVGCVQVRTAPPLDGEVIDAVLAGANAVLTCADGIEELYAAVRVVADGDIALEPRVVHRVLDTVRQEHGTSASRVELTARQRSVLELIVRGESVKQTARTLGIAVKTVENTQSRLYRRLGVRNRSQAVAVAMRSGLVGRSEPEEPA